MRRSYKRSFSIIMLCGAVIICPAIAQDSVTEAYSAQGQRALDRGDIRAAKRLFKQAYIADHDASHGSLYMARLCNNLGECYRRLSQDPNYILDDTDLDEQGLTGREQLLGVSKKYFKRALDFKETVMSTDSLLVARTLENLARAHYEDNMLDEAEGLLRKALQIRDYKNGPGHVDSASDYLTLGDICSHDARHSYKEAEANYKAALQIWNRSCPAMDPVLGRCHEKLAVLYFKSNRLELAGDHFDRAVAIFTKNGAQCAKNLSFIRRELQDLPLECYVQCFNQLDTALSRGQLGGSQRIVMLRKLLIASRRLGKGEDVKYLELELRKLGRKS